MYIYEYIIYIYMNIYIYIYIYIYVITCARFRLKQMWQLTKAMAEMKRDH